MPAGRLIFGLFAVLMAGATQAADAPVPPPDATEKAPPPPQLGVAPADAQQPPAQVAIPPSQSAKDGPPAVAATPDTTNTNVTPATSPPAVKPPSVTVIDTFDAKGILGRDVRSPASENMGRIADVIVDRAGQVRGAVIDFGGFLGVGSRKIVVDWAALHFWNVADKTASITLDLTREQVRAAPEYKDDQPMVVLGASGKLTPLRFPPITMQER